jgi:hypothetical protein
MATYHRASHRDKRKADARAALPRQESAGSLLVFGLLNHQLWHQICWYIIEELASFIFIVSIQRRSFSAVALKVANNLIYVAIIAVHHY